MWQVVAAGKGFSSFISGKNMDDIIKLVEPLEKLGLLMDGAIEKVEYKIKKNSRRWISLCYDGTYVCFIDDIYGFFINETNCFFNDKCFNWKRSHKG